MDQTTSTSLLLESPTNFSPNASGADGEADASTQHTEMHQPPHQTNAAAAPNNEQLLARQQLAHDLMRPLTALDLGMDPGSMSVPHLIQSSSRHSSSNAALVAPPSSLMSSQSFSSSTSSDDFRTSSNGSSRTISNNAAAASPVPSPPLPNDAHSAAGPSASSANPNLPPPPHTILPQPAPLPSGAAFPFWVGCWNMGAKEMSHRAPVAVPVATPAAAAASASANPGVTPAASAASSMTDFADWIPTGYKMYVVGLQESISEHTYKMLDAFFALPAFECTRLMIPLSASSASIASNTLMTLETNGGGEQATPIFTGTVKIEGRGDGSFLHPKCTSIAIWIHRAARPLVSYCAHGALSLGITQGSKGGAAIALKVLDTTLVFMSVHLSSTSLSSRRQSYTSLIEAMGNVLGEKYFQGLELFHHTFWLGDMNFRVRDDLGAAEAVKFMQRKDVRGLLEYDELGNEIRVARAANLAGTPRPPMMMHQQQHQQPQLLAPSPSNNAAPIGGAITNSPYSGPYASPVAAPPITPLIGSHCAFGAFTEAPIDFFPTYKKHEARPIPSTSGALARGENNIYWVHQVYKTIYKQPWYKSGNTAQRIPSWCDRILRYSLPDQATRIQVLEFHPHEQRDRELAAQCSPATRNRSRLGGVGGTSTYRAFEDGLSGSDHTAVSCGFQLALSKIVDWNAPFMPPTMQPRSGSPRTLPGAAAIHANGTRSNSLIMQQNGVPSSSLVQNGHTASPMTSPTAGPTNNGISPLLTMPQLNRTVSTPSRGPSPGTAANNRGSFTLGSSAQQPHTIAMTIYHVRLLWAHVLPAPAYTPHSPMAHFPLPIASNASPKSSAVASSTPSTVKAPFIVPPQAPELGGQEPRYVRVLFPAPFEIDGPCISKQVSFSATQQQNGGGGVPPSPMLVPTDLFPQSYLAGAMPNNSPSAANQSNGGIAQQQPPHYKAEFRCAVPDDTTFVAPAPGSPNGDSFSSNLPPPAPFHFLLKIHSADNLSGQCVVALPKDAFASKLVLEFHEKLTRDGLPLIHPITKMPVQVHFFLDLEMTRQMFAATSQQQQQPQQPMTPLTPARDPRHTRSGSSTDARAQPN